MSGLAEQVLNHAIHIGEVVIDNAEVEGLLGKAAVGIAAGVTVGLMYGIYKVCTDSKTAENITSIVNSVKK
jgi:hypothetical protein